MSRQALEYFFPGSCYETVIENRDFGDGQCTKLLYSRFLSLTVLVGAIIVKVPQIMKVVRSGSAAGLSYVAIILELLGLTFTCTYNLAKGFTFSAWGESLFIAVQVLILMSLMFHLNGDYPHFLVFPLYGGVVWYLTSPYISMDMLGILQASVIPLILSSRLTQIYTIYSNQSTGQISFITSFLNWAGTASRIFTTLQETQDNIILFMYISNFIVNGIIVLQFLIYPSGTAKPPPSKKEE